MDTKTVAAVVSAMLFLAMLTVIVIAGVLGTVFIYRKKKKTKNDSVYTAGEGARANALIMLLNMCNFNHTM